MARNKYEKNDRGGASREKTTNLNAASKTDAYVVNTESLHSATCVFSNFFVRILGD